MLLRVVCGYRDRMGRPPVLTAPTPSPWLHGAQALHLAPALLVAALLVYFSATWFQKGNER